MTILQMIGKIMGRTKLNLVGHRFGKWIVNSEREARGKYGEVFWNCKCDCGSNRTIRASNLMQGITKSCGCWQHSESHNMTGTRTFKSWESMKQRCLNSNSPDYQAYGGRGISVCERWINSFDNFFADMGHRPKDASLDRIDVNGPYSPENCRWATRSQQNSNKQKTLKVFSNGVEKTVHEWAKEVGISARVISDRIRAGWTPERALTAPNRKAKSISF